MKKLLLVKYGGGFKGFLYFVMVVGSRSRRGKKWRWKKEFFFAIRLLKGSYIFVEETTIGIVKHLTNHFENFLFKTYFKQEYR